MKLASRKPVSTSEWRRGQMQTDRTRAPAMRDSYPQPGHLRIELNFVDDSERSPSPQLHSFYPAARAFFRFTCPCAECDGDFDLTPAVDALMAGAGKGPLTTERVAHGHLLCQGIHLRDRENSKPCQMGLKFTLTAAV
jgi:hypothetical protein